MAFSGGYRQRSPLFIVSAVGVFLFGIAVLGVSIRDRLKVNRIPTGAEELWQTGYGDLLTTEVKPTVRQEVVVTVGDLYAGDQVLPEFLELRSAQWVVEKYPEFEIPGAKGDPERDLVQGFYEYLMEPVGQYAVLDIPAGTPLAPDMLLPTNPYRDRTDDGRPDRFTIAAPEEPSIYPLLEVGDRVDVFVIVGQNSVRRTVRNCRVVAIQNVVTKDSGLLNKAEQAKLSSLEEAGLRKKAWIESQSTGAAAPPAEQPPAEDGQPAEPPADPNAAAEGAAEGAAETAPAEPPSPEEQDIPDDAIILDRPKYDGRTITLQVSQQEAMVLSLANNLPGIRIDLALHPRP
jgi:hypothetical protein